MTAIAECDTSRDPHTTLEYIIVQISSCSIMFKQKNKTESNNLQQMTQEYNQLMANSYSLDIDQSYQNELSIKIDKGQELLEEELRIIAGIKWCEEGERSSKFFPNLIKQKSVSNTMNCFIDDDGLIITKSADISKHGYSFYSKLYSATVTPVIDNKLFSNIPLLNHEQSVSICKPLTIE